MSDFKILGKPALLILHMQNFMVGENIKTNPEFAGVVKSSGIISKQQALLKAFRSKKLPVIFVTMNTAEGIRCQTPAYGFLWGSLKPLNLTPKDKEIIPELAPQPQEYVLTHWAFGPFNNSGLDLVLKSLGVDTVVIAGFATNGVVYSAVVEAADYYYSTIVPSDASASISKKAHEAVMEIMAPALALVATTEDVIAHL
jgi:nicotinamidase-related amidase